MKNAYIFVFKLKHEHKESYFTLRNINITQILASDDNIIVSYVQVDLNIYKRKPIMQSQCLLIWLNNLLSFPI